MLFRSFSFSRLTHHPRLPNKGALFARSNYNSQEEPFQPARSSLFPRSGTASIQSYQLELLVSILNYPLCSLYSTSRPVEGIYSIVASRLIRTDSAISALQTTLRRDSSLKDNPRRTRAKEHAPLALRFLFRPHISVIFYLLFL